MTLLPSPQILNWLDDETLFSLVSRHHALSGAVRPRDTCERFFGHPRAGTQHDLPCNLDVFVARTNHFLGDAASIIRDRTLLPYYLPFRSDAVAAEATESLRGPAIGSLKYRLGILTSRFRAHHPLKACSLCMESDVTQHGVAYWHRAHQFPGVWCCPLHEVPLQESAVKANGVKRFFWHLPSASHLVTPSIGLGRPTIEVGTLSLLRLSRLTRDYITWGGRIDEARLISAYQYALDAKGLLNPAGGLKLTRIAEDFSRHVGPLRCVLELHDLPGDDRAASVQVGRLLRAPRTGTHPVRHLVLIDWLFGDWPSFLRTYEVATKWDERPPEQIRSHPDPDNRTRLLQMLRDDAISLTESARIVGVDVATATGWARQAGLTARSRPKMLGPDRLTEVHAQLICGDSTAEVAAVQRLSVPTINRILRAHPVIGAKAHEARAARARSDQRKAWATATAEHPTLSAKALRTLIPACYAWLYRNDRHWLMNAAAGLPAAATPTAPRVDWQARDLELEKMVERTILQLSIEGPDQPIELWRIYQRVPALKAKLGHLDRLPRTRYAIERAVTRRRRRSGQDLFS